VNIFEALADNPSCREVLAPVASIPSSVDLPRRESGEDLTCADCDALHVGWCKVIEPGKFFNAKLLTVCPLQVPECVKKAVLRFGCLLCGDFDVSHNTAWC